MNLKDLMKRDMESKTCRFKRLTSKEAPETDAVDGESFPPETPAGDNNAKKRVEQIENVLYQLPMRLINLLEKPDNWRKRSLNKINGTDTTGKDLYSEVHQNALLYKNLYEYLNFR